MEIFLIWCLFGLVSAVAAANKGRNAFGWFCLGMLLGPFGLILALLMPALDAQEKAPPLVRRCPFCAELIQTLAVKCRFCTADLADPWPFEANKGQDTL